MCFAVIYRSYNKSWFPLLPNDENAGGAEAGEIKSSLLPNDESAGGVQAREIKSSLLPNDEMPEGAEADKIVFLRGNFQNSSSCD
jgi:hypothetical protein